MASVIHKRTLVRGVADWAAKAQNSNIEASIPGRSHPWRYIIAKRNRIDGIEAVV